MAEKYRTLRAAAKCWTWNAYNTIYHNHKPVPYSKSVEIIKAMHEAMVDFMIRTKRPIQLRKSLGYMLLTKNKPKGGRIYHDWTEYREKGRPTKKINHHSHGYTYRLRFEFSRAFKLMKFIPNHTHKKRLSKLIFNKEIDNVQ